MVHTSEEAGQMAAWGVSAGRLATVRICPLCGNGPGTARHVIMVCSAMRPLVLNFLDAVELELTRARAVDDLLAAARCWQAAEAENGKAEFFGDVPPATAGRWPILTAWRWLVPMPTREQLYGAEPRGRSEEGVRMEYAMDMGYRALMPRQLGKALCCPTEADVEGVGVEATEDYATARQLGQAMEEQHGRSKAAREIWPTVRLTTLLVIGLRKIRAEYAQRTQAWIRLARLHSQAQPAPAPNDEQPAQRPSGRESLQQWCLTDGGRQTVRQLRWLAPTEQQALARIRVEVPTGRLVNGTILGVLQNAGVPVKQGGDLNWGTQHGQWSSAKQRLQQACDCADAHQAAAVSCCVQCGGARLPVDPWGPARPCRWCQGLVGDRCRGCGHTVHFKGACRRLGGGADRAYGAGALEAHWICPDCAWRWVRALAAMPRAGPAVPVEARLRNLMEAAATEVRTGAGSDYIPPRGLCPTRVVHKKLLRWARGLNEEFSSEQAIQWGLTEFQHDDADRAGQTTRLLEVLGILVHEACLIDVTLQGTKRYRVS